MGIANDKSIAWGCARAFHKAGAELAGTYLNEKAEVFVRPLLESLACPIILPLNVSTAGQMEAVFEAIEKRWANLDFLLHSIAFSPKQDLNGRVVDCSREGFLTAMDISCHTFLRMAKLAEPLMKQGGSMLTVSYYGSEKVIPHYNIMGPVKAALECAVRYMAAELGRKDIRVNAVSPGPIPTRAASGIECFDELLKKSQEKSPLHHPIDLDDVGNLAAFLASPAAKNITGQVHYVDAGYAVCD